MDLNFSPDDLAFRGEVRAFLHDQLPSSLRAKVRQGVHLTRDDHLLWQRTLHARGWSTPGWPKAFNGPGWNAAQQYIFDDECAAAGAPRLIPFGIKMVAPVIMTFGSPAQQQHFLPRIQAAEDWWCQGYSEPGSGSDLASVKTRAVLDADASHYVVNGQKTWTTLGQHADWIFCLVRTDTQAKPQRGISFLLIDMKSAGITVRPIITLDGAHEVNEVWFENVRVPVGNRVGEENEGWTYAKFLLGHERTNIAGIGIAKRELARLKEIASHEHCNGRPLREDPLFSLRIAQVEIDLMALEVTNLRVLSDEAAERSPGAAASILKIKGTEIQQEISSLLLRAAGSYGLAFLRDAIDGKPVDTPGPAHAFALAANYCNLRKLSIYGGSNEIQKNIVAQTILGL